MTKPLLTLSAIALFAGGMMSGRLLFPISQKNDPEASSNSTRTITERTTKSRDLSRQVDTIAALPPSGDQQQQLASTLRAMIDEDPGKVLELVSSVRDYQDREDLTRDAAKEWINQSPAEALQWLEAQSAGSLRSTASHSMFYGAIHSFPSLAGQVFEHMDSDNRSHAITPLISKWAKIDLASAKQFLEKIDNPAILKNGIEAIMKPWSQGNPTDALAFFEQHEDLFGTQKVSVIMNIAGGWATKNPHEALEWAASLEDPELKNYAKQKVEATWSQNDPSSAAQAGVLAHAGDWILQDPQAAKSWIQSLEPHKQISAISDTLIALTIESPSQAAELYEEMRSWPPDPNHPGANFSNAVGTLAVRWSRKDPQAATAWLHSLEPSPVTDYALSRASTELAEYAPVQAAELFAKITLGKFRDEAARNIVAQNAREYPQVAFEWSQKIDDDTLRLRKTGDVLRQLQSQEDFEEAREMVHRANLTEAEKAKLLQGIHNQENNLPQPYTGKPGIDLPIPSPR